MTRIGTLIRALAAVAGLTRLARAARRRTSIEPRTRHVDASISVIVPARNEASRIGPLLEAIVGAPGVAEVLIVDDESTDGTAGLAAGAGATVIVGHPLPARWVGKAWALQQGLDAATGEWVVTFDADTRPEPTLPTALVACCDDNDLDLATVAGHFECPSATLRCLHPALLTTLLLRATPTGGPVHRLIGNGQCMAFRRTTLVAAGGFRPVGHHTVEDVALVRSMATAGFAVGFLDASSLLSVRMYESAREAWRGWGRSLSLPGVDPWWRRSGDLATVMVIQVLPLLRLVARRADRLDALLLAVRLGTLIGTRHAYRPRGVAYWLSPLADGPAVATLASGLVRRRQRWRGRTY